MVALVISHSLAPTCGARPSLPGTTSLAAACNEHELEYVSIDYHARLGESKIRPWHAYEFTLLILRTIVYFNPLKVFVPLAAESSEGLLLTSGSVSIVPRPRYSVLSTM